MDNHSISSAFLLGAIFLVFAIGIRKLAATTLAVMLLATLFPNDAVAQMILRCAGALVGPLFLFWILWIAFRNIVGIRPTRHRCGCHSDER